MYWLFLMLGLLIAPSQALLRSVRVKITSHVDFRSASSRFSTRSDTVPGSLIICGPSGAGKGTIIDKLMKNSPDKYSLSVSHTTRKPRTGEVDGKHYHFVSKEQMEADIALDETNKDKEGYKFKFLEHAVVHTNLYGTSVASVKDIHSQGKTAILDVDERGVTRIYEMNILPCAEYIFIVPPSLAILEQRLKDRGTETAEEVALRLHNAEKCMLFGQQMGQSIFDFTLKNDDLDRAVKELEIQIEKWKQE